MTNKYPATCMDSIKIWWDVVVVAVVGVIVAVVIVVIGVTVVVVGVV